MPRLPISSGKRRMVPDRLSCVYYLLDLQLEPSGKFRWVIQFKEVLPDNFLQRLLQEREQGAIDIGEPAVEVEDVSEIRSVRQCGIEGSPLFAEVCFRLFLIFYVSTGAKPL